MTTPKLRLVSFGSAKALTQDGEIGPYFELLIVQSRTRPERKGGRPCGDRPEARHQEDPMPRQVTLAAGLHMVRIRDDVVILDVGADRYSCLVGGGNQLTPVGSGAVSADDDVLQELQSAGLIAPDPGGPTCRTPVAPRGELTAEEYPGRIACLDTAIRTLAATAAFRGQSLAQLVGAAEPRSSRPTPFDCRRISARVSAYRTVLPFIPFEGLCLQRAYQLRRVFASDGQRVDWVFGVKTWPFFAHCWLQIDDLVIGDRLDRVRSFAPIAVF